MSVHAEIDDGHGEASVVERHAVDVAHGRGRHAVGRAEQRDDRAARRIAPDPQPGEAVEDEQERQPDPATASGDDCPATASVACCAAVGGVTTPLSHAAATVSPLFGGSGRVVRNTMRPGSCTTTVASLPRAPCGPV